MFLHSREKLHKYMQRCGSDLFSFGKLEAVARAEVQRNISCFSALQKFA